MKTTKVLLSMAAFVGLGLAGCSNNEFEAIQNSNSIIKATMEATASTKINVTEAGKLTWSKGDQIGIYTSANSFCQYTLKGDGGDTQASFEGLLFGTPQHGFYPYSENHKVTGTDDMTFHLPGSYGDFNTEHSDKVNVPMLAEVTSEQAVTSPLPLNFKHLGGAVLFKIEGVPAGTVQFVFKANSRITGDFDILPGVDGHKIIALPINEEHLYNETVTLCFKKLAESKDMTFIVPLPTGTYRGFKIELKDEEDKSLYSLSSDAVNVLNRTTLAIMPVLKFTGANGNIEDLGKENENAIEVTPGNYTTEFAKAVEGSVFKLAEGEYPTPVGITQITGKQNLTFIGAGDPAKTIIDLRANGNASVDNAFYNSTVTFKNLTLRTLSIDPKPQFSEYAGFGHCSATYMNCVIVNSYTLYGESKFENCTFNVTGDMYNVRTYGTNATFTNCKFNCDGKAALIYHENTPEGDCATFTNCTFNDMEGLSNETKAAIEIGADNSTDKHTVYINHCTVIGFANTEVKTNPNHKGTNSGNNVWGNKNMMIADNLNVFINGIEKY